VNKRLTTLIALTLCGLALVLAALACQSEEPSKWNTYRLDPEYPAFWVCASSTPTPTRRPPPPPVGWPITATWEPPNYPPTPYPTATPYYRFGEFYLRQAIWLPWHQTSSNLPDGVTLEPGPHYLRIMLAEVRDLDGCYGFYFEIESFADVPVDFHAYNQIFVKRRREPEKLYHTDLDTLRHYGIVDVEANPSSWFWTIPPHQSITRTVAVCVPGSEDPQSLQVGIFTSPHESNVSGGLSSGAPSSGADTAIYINPWEIDQDCYFPPHPELTYFPGLPDVLPYTNSPGGGRLGAYSPVGVPPCYHVTRGFGCVSTWTGVVNPNCPLTAPFWHTGVDISCAEGLPVFHSSTKGKIVSWGDGGLYGILASVQDGPFRVLYAHLSALGGDPLCSGTGNWCDPGRIIGFVGSTGNSTGPHLHWELRVNNLSVDPVLYMGGQANKLDTNTLLASSALLPAMQVSTPMPDAYVYPLQIILRDEAGQPLSGPTLQVSDIDGLPAGTCAFAGGQCELSLPPGSYSIKLGGQLADGTPVDAYGQANLNALNSGRHSEGYRGPLAVWHEAPASTLALVLVIDAQGVAQPYFDTNPGGQPQPLDPMQYLEPEATPTTAIQPAAAPPSSGGLSTGVPAQAGSPSPIQPTVTPQANYATVPGTNPLGLFLICAALLSLIVGAVLAGRLLRKGRKQ